MNNQLPFKFPDRYSYLGERLQGGQGYVYLCKDSYLDRTVAVKVVSTPTNLKALKHELSFLTEIRSGHIAEVYDLLEASSGKHIGLVQQFVGGKHLLDPADKQTITTFLRSLYQLACGLLDIHSFKKVHRDLKPANIRFDEEGILKILDFGICMHIDGEGLTKNGKGTMPYLAPELYSLPAAYTAAVDIYAFGVLAHHLAFGKVVSSLKTAPPQLGQSASPFITSPLGIPAEVASLLDLTLSVLPTFRPGITSIKKTLGRRLDYGLHRAAVTHRGKSTVLTEANKSLSIKLEECSIAITYDGLRFIVSSVSGTVDINNIKAQLGQELPASCVVTMSPQNTSREFITVDMSHPGILL